MANFDIFFALKNKHQTIKVILRQTFILLFTTSAAVGQQISELKVTKAIPDINSNPITSIEVYIPMNVEGFDVNNPIEYDQSEVSIFKDDTGKDLLAAHKKLTAEYKEKGYSTESIYQFGGIADYGANKDINLVFYFKTTPAKEAKELHLKADISFNFIDESSTKGIELENVPTEMSYNSAGYKTSIGNIRIDGRGSATFGDEKYKKFSVSSKDSPIVSVEVIGGDDREKVKGIWSVSQNEFVFQEVPETVNLKVTYASFKQVNVPIDLEFSLGL